MQHKIAGFVVLFAQLFLTISTEMYRELNIFTPDPPSPPCLPGAPCVATPLYYWYPVYSNEDIDVIKTSSISRTKAETNQKRESSPEFCKTMTAEPWLVYSEYPATKHVILLAPLRYVYHDFAINNCPTLQPYIVKKCSSGDYNKCDELYLSRTW